MDQRIAIYQGEGASPFSLPGALVLTARELIEGDWDSFISCLIVPGGRDRPYHAALKGAGNRKIRGFVERGGSYLGLCAGAYYGCRAVDFDRGLSSEVCEERELAFFPGAGVGPAYGRGTYDYASRKGARAARLSSPLGPLYAYYNGGCLFSGDLSSCRILARYLDLPGTPPAIIACQIGKGRAILSGVHLEISPADLDLLDLYHAQLLPPLQETEPLRKTFWESLLSELAQHFPADQVEMEMENRLPRVGPAIRQKPVAV